MAGDETLFDVIVVGSGAAGVSCAHRLVAAGRRVLMLDGGRRPVEGPPDVPFMEYRTTAGDQGPVLFGPDYGARGDAADESPKLRIPSLAYVFEGFAQACGLRTNGFDHAGSLAVGGMTNAWGGGVACFTDEDVAGWPIGRADLVPSYREVVRRIGVSGRPDDDLRDFFAWDDDLQEPPPLSESAEMLLTGYVRGRERAVATGFRLGRGRNAILSEDGHDRRGCDRLGWCLWGCPRRSIYSARHDLELLVRHPGFTHLPARVVRKVARVGNAWAVHGAGPSAGEAFELRARHVALACGPIATARLVLDALQLFDRAISFCSCPSAAFAVLLPKLIGRTVGDRVFASAQVSFALDVEGAAGKLFGNVFSPACLPMSEFIGRSPLPARSSIVFFRAAMPALLVGNVFMPGALSDHRLAARPDGGLDVTWGYSPALDDGFVREVRRRISRSMRACGAYLVPGGFKPSNPGSDMHYGATVPMRSQPAPHEATAEGEVQGLPGVFVVDGSALPSLPAKAHTLTIMANADRIGGIIAARCSTRRS